MVFEHYPKLVTENLDGFPPVPSLLRGFVVHSVLGQRISSFFILPSAFSRPLSAILAGP
jgi:hypothetical protein